MPPVPIVPGPEESCLICGFLYEPDAERVRPMRLAEAAAWLSANAEASGDDPFDGRAPAPSPAVTVPRGTLADAQPDPRAAKAGDAFVWLHFNLSDNAALLWLQRHAGLHDTFYETLRDGLHATRIERAEQSLIAVLNDVRFEFSFEPSDIATMWISVDRHLVVTARRQPLRSIDQLRTDAKRGEVLASPPDLLEHLLRAQADVLVGIVRGVTTRIDDIEDDLLGGKLQFKRVRLGGLRRLLVRLQRLLAPEPAALFRLLQHPPAWMAPRDVEELREATEEFSVVLRDMATLQERIKLLQEEIAAQVAEDNNRSLFVLTAVTVLALPINLIAGLLGMNVGGVPLADYPHGFAVVVVIVLSFTGLAALLALRRRRDR